MQKFLNATVSNLFKKEPTVRKKYTEQMCSLDKSLIW